MTTTPEPEPSEREALVEDVYRILRTSDLDGRALVREVVDTILAARPAPVVSAATFTERQAAAWPDAVARINRHGVYASADPASPDWSLNWHEEVRPGRGHYLDAQFNDGEHFAQIAMDVYGAPTVSVASLDWLHSDGNEECDCEPCQVEWEQDR